MITWVPYADNKLNAKVLDMARLGKQINEAKFLLQDLFNRDSFGLSGNTSPSFRYHPVWEMWATYEEALMSYMGVMCLEWKRRGKQGDELSWLKYIAHKEGLHLKNWRNVETPWWWGKAKIHYPHRHNLLLKDPLWYGTQPYVIGQLKWNIPEKYKGRGFIWPREDNTYRDMRH